MLIESLPDESFDNGLAAHVEVVSSFVRFFQHAGGEIDIDSLYGLDHAALAFEKPREATSPGPGRSPLRVCGEQRAL